MTSVPDLPKLESLINSRLTHIPAAETKDLCAFLKSPRGLALSFCAMNEYWTTKVKKGSAFRCHEDEWAKGKVINWCPVPKICNSHTHYIQPGGAKGVTHFGGNYQRGAHGHWWLFPDAYNLSIGDGHVKAKVMAPTDAQHTSDCFCRLMSQAWESHARKMGIIIMPAPGNAGVIMNGSDTDMASYDDMRRTADKINAATEHDVCHVAGVIECAAGAGLHPEINRNPSRVWKIYPASHWTNAGQDWLINHLPTALELLQATERPHTVCIHWWDGDEDPQSSDKELDRVLSKFEKINFVLFHACYPNHARLAALLETHDNIFAEIGGTFANQIMGLHGEDSGPPNPAPAPPGIPSAVELFGTLRGAKHQNDGKIVFGTDAIWHGSPVWQVEALKRLVLTPDEEADRAFKRKVLCDNTKRAFPVLA